MSQESFNYEEWVIWNRIDNIKKKTLERRVINSMQFLISVAFILIIIIFLVIPFNPIFLENIVLMVSVRLLTIIVCFMGYVIIIYSLENW